MISINANLPSLGSYQIRFHKESKEILEFLGSSELSRLDEVSHLGVASYVFTGTNHSRLEYLLLQCAIVEMLPRFHRGVESLSLSGAVKIPKQSSRISSGEELLKSWFILSGSGHAQHTYGVERSLLNRVCADEKFKEQFLHGVPSYLKHEIERIIDGYLDSEFHYLLSLVRISRLPKGSRLKAKLFRLMYVLMTPKNSIEMADSADLYKLYRLRTLHDRVRLLSIVALDSYYSHHPIRYEVSPALVSIDTLFKDTGVTSEFLRLLETTAGWLADELYMHPSAAAAQKQYELDAARKLESKFCPKIHTPEQFYQMFQNLMNTGFGKPKVSNLYPFARFTFPYSREGPIFGKSVYSLTTHLEAQISPSEKDQVSVLVNPFTGHMHLDILYNVGIADSQSIGVLCARVNKWLIRHVNALLINRIRRFRLPQSSSDIPKSSSDFPREQMIERIKRNRIPAGIISAVEQSLRSLLEGAVRFLLPEGLEPYYSEVMPTRHPQEVLAKIKLLDEHSYNPLIDKLKKKIRNNESQLDQDRLHELKMLHAYIEKSKAETVVACIEKYKIRDSNGNDVDDWDGVVLEIYEKRTTLTVLEAKNTKPASSRANRAFTQLKDTQTMMKRRIVASSNRRQRMPGLGAYLKIVF